MADKGNNKKGLVQTYRTYRGHIKIGVKQYNEMSEYVRHVFQSRIQHIIIYV